MNTALKFALIGAGLYFLFKDKFPLLSLPTAAATSTAAPPIINPASTPAAAVFKARLRQVAAAGEDISQGLNFWQWEYYWRAATGSTENFPGPEAFGVTGQAAYQLLSIDEFWQIVTAGAAAGVALPTMSGLRRR